MATEISKKALHEFLLVKCKEQMIEFTKKFKLRGNAPKINKLKAKLTRVINEGGSSEEILDIQSQMRELVDEDVMSALKNRKNYSILEDERPSKPFLNLENAKRGYNEVILLNKNNPNFDPTMEEIDRNPRLMPIKDRQGINDEFHQAFQKIYSKQEVEDSPEAIQEFLDSGGDAQPSEYLNSKALTKEESESIDEEITLTKLNHALFKKMKGSSAPGIDGFTVNWLRKFWDSYKDGALTSPLKTGIIRLLRKGQKDPTLTGNYRPISLLSIHYKLASCCITQRLRPMVGKVIGQQQKAYVPGNVIGSCIINILNLMKYTNRSMLHTHVHTKLACDEIHGIMYYFYCMINV